MKRRQQRMLAVTGLVLGAAVVVGLGLLAFQQNLMYFYSPSDVAAGAPPAEARFRLGGIVKDGSVVREPDSLEVRFTLEDCEHAVTVRYAGILPDLFREGQGIIAAGQMDAALFVADQVLAKHDENYMPPELVDSLKDGQGQACMPSSMGDPTQAGYVPEA